MNSILYYKGYTQYHNIGDQLINKSLLNHFRKYTKVIISDAKMPQFYLKNLSVSPEEQISRTNSGFHGALLLDALKSCFNKQRKVYFLASPPGHQFDNSFVIGCKYIITGIFYLLLSVLGVHIIKIGFSIGPLSAMGKIGEKFRALFVRSYYVRDSISLQYVHRLGINHAKFFPDLCWSYQPDQMGGASNLQSNSLSGELPKVVLSFRNAVHGEGEEDAYGQSLIILLEEVLATYHRSYRFEIAYQVASDQAFSVQLYEVFKGKYNLSLRETPIDLPGAGYYHAADFVLTNRLHVALLAYKFQCLPIILTDIKQHAKINGIFSDAGLQELLVDTQDPVSVVLNDIHHVFQHKVQLQKKLETEEATYQRASINTMDDIFA